MRKQDFKENQKYPIDSVIIFFIQNTDKKNFKEKTCKNFFGKKKNISY